MFLKVRLHRQVLASKDAETGVGNPRRISQHEDRLWQLSDNTLPIGGEEVRFNQIHLIGIASPLKSDSRTLNMLGLDVGRKRSSNPRESV